MHESINFHEGIDGIYEEDLVSNGPHVPEYEYWYWYDRICMTGWDGKCEDSPGGDLCRSAYVSPSRFELLFEIDIKVLSSFPWCETAFPGPIPRSTSPFFRLFHCNQRLTSSSPRPTFHVPLSTSPFAVRSISINLYTTHARKIHESNDDETVRITSHRSRGR